VNATPAFSVVVPAYNASRTIGATIGSILRQTRKDLELIVVDDGSSDGTPELVRELGSSDARLRLIEQPNAGTAGARNTGIAAARANLVSFLDNDDMWMPRYLEAMDQALARVPEAGFGYTDAWVLNDATGRIRKKPSLQHHPPIPDPASPDDLLSRFLTGLNFVMSSTTVRREVLEATTGFDERIRGADDFDLWIRIAARGYGAVRADGINLVQRDRSDSQSKDLPMMIENARAVLRNAAANDDLAESDRAIASASVEEHGRFLETLSGERKASALAWRLRRRVAPVRQRMTRERVFMAELPPEIADALPELLAEDRSGA
jgi:glycosyltransferase involved in cell wall biosynthesis